MNLKKKIIFGSIFLVIALLMIIFQSDNSYVKTAKSSDARNAKAPTVRASTARVPSATNINQNPIAGPISRTKSVRDWLENYSVRGGISVRGDQLDQITTISRFGYPGKWHSKEDGIEFAQNFAEKIGVPKDQIDLVNATESSSANIAVYRYPQSIGGYPVYGSFVQYSQDINHELIFHINNELKNIENPNLEINFSESAARDQISKQIPNATTTKKIAQPSQIYVQSGGQAQLVWIFQVERGLGKMVDRDLVFVSTSDGSILHTQSMIIH
jgi:hypothetical protein